MPFPFVPLLIGAGIGALTNRDDPLKGALIGGAGGALTGGLANALAAPSGAAAGLNNAALQGGIKEASQAVVQEGITGSATNLATPGMSSQLGTIADSALSMNPVPTLSEAMSGAQMAPSLAGGTPTAPLLSEGAMVDAAIGSVPGVNAPLPQDMGLAQRLATNFQQNTSPEALKANFKQTAKDQAQSLALQAMGGEEQQQPLPVAPPPQQMPFQPVQRQIPQDQFAGLPRQMLSRRVGSRRFT